MIDTHTHLNFHQFENDLESVINRSFENGVGKIINVGSDLESSKRAIEISQKYGNLYVSVGIHPTDKLISANNDLYPKLKNLAKNPKVIAIGECGLDYFRLKSNHEDEKQRQKDLFKLQIRLAQELSLPLIIHSRDAKTDTLNILNSKFPRRFGRVPDFTSGIIQNSKPNGVAHCFSYDLETAQEFIKLGFLIGITAIITYPNAEDLRKVVKELPLEKIIIETDCPYLAPQSHRGERNEPVYVVETAQKIAEIKDISLKEVETQTTKNAESLFGI